MMDETLRQTIIQELNLKDLTSEEVDRTITELGGLIFQAIVLKVAEGLSDHKLKELDTIIDIGAQEELAEFLTANVHNLDEIVQECSSYVIGEYKRSQEEFSRDSTV